MYILTNNLKKAKIWPTRKEASESRDLNYNHVHVVSDSPTKHHIEVVRSGKVQYVKAVEVIL